MWKHKLGSGGFGEVSNSVLFFKFQYTFDDGGRCLKPRERDVPTVLPLNE